MLPDVLAALRCPVCELPFEGGRAPTSNLKCPAGHAFDQAKQGYVNLLVGKDPGTGDSAEMISRRAAFLAAGHYAPIAGLLPAAPAGGLVTEVGAGTGYYLATVVERSPGSVGLGLDVSKFAARRAAKAHPRVAAVVADCWRRLPLADRSVDLLLDVFAPRNSAEFARVLKPTGRLAVITPLPEHLAELRTTLGMLGVEDGKADRVRDTLGEQFEQVEESELRQTMRLDRATVVNVVGMGPSARHIDPAARVGALPAEVEVTLAVRLGVCRLGPQ